MHETKTADYPPYPRSPAEPRGSGSQTHTPDLPSNASRVRKRHVSRSWEDASHLLLRVFSHTHESRRQEIQASPVLFLGKDQPHPHPILPLDDRIPYEQHPHPFSPKERSHRVPQTTAHRPRSPQAVFQWLWSLGGHRTCGWDVVSFLCTWVF